MLADRHRLFEIGRVRVEEGQADLAGVVMREDPVGHRLVAARRRLVPVDAQLERHDLALGRAGDARSVAPVDDRMRQHEQQIAGAGVAVAEIGRHDLLDHAGDLRPDAFERSDRRKQRVEEGRAHNVSLGGADRRAKADIAAYPRYMRACNAGLAT